MKPKRISEAQYLSRVQDIMNNVLAHTDNDIPEQLKDRDVAKAFYGLTVEALSEKIQDNIVRKEVATQTALQIDDLIQDSVLDNGKAIIDWQYKTNITGKLLIDIGDYLIDEVRDKHSARPVISRHGQDCRRIVLKLLKSGTSDDGF
jgi:type I restriction enzyme, R subunit